MSLDSNIYVKSKRAGERVLENTIEFIEETLKLRVNRSKSGVFRPRQAKFLGYTLSENYVHGLAAFGPRLKKFRKPAFLPGLKPRASCGKFCERRRSRR